MAQAQQGFDGRPIGALLGIFGGLLIAVFQLGLTPGFYVNDVLTSLTVDDVASGVGKSYFFAFFITVVACRNGLQVTGGADGVGRATTAAVVFMIITILVLDATFPPLFLN